jgi:uncharacterized repeat protein (TIGR03803 family)
MKILRIGCAFGGFLSLVLSLSAQTFTTLHSFEDTDGAYPNAGLVQATDGNLYGTTGGGGANDGGTVFKIAPSGTLTTLYSFCSQSGCSDGANPYAVLVQATDGKLYGTTSSGGTTNNGTVFKITPSGTLTTLYSFCSKSGCTDGAGPLAGLVQATNGDLYGTTEFYGAYGYGTVFKITSAGTLTTLHSFAGYPTDGAYPVAGLIQTTNGDLYGTTANGGANSCEHGGRTLGCGTVFKIAPSGMLTTLYSFCSQSGCTDGQNPDAGLVQATNGDLYGTTFYGGAFLLNQVGTVFKITPSGTLTTLHSFYCTQSGCTDGELPYAGLVQATDGNFYGTTLDGGVNDYCEFEGLTAECGTVFKITAGGMLTRLYSFCSQGGSNCTDGAYPYAALVQATNGNFYGTTDGGGANDDGTVFSLSLGLGPFVKTLPTAAQVGAEVGILGTNLTGATNVYFNTTPAQFEVVSPTLILTHVPTGATTGTINVQFRPSHFILFSNIPFYVLK